MRRRQLKVSKLIVLLVQMSFFGYVSAFQPFQHSGGNEDDFATGAYAEAFAVRFLIDADAHTVGNDAMPVDNAMP